MAWIKKGHITPFWDIDDIEKLSFDIPDDPSVGFDFLRQEDKNLYFPNLVIKRHKGLPDILSSLDKDSIFNFISEKSYAIHMMLPGSVLPLHKDRYSYFKKTYKIEDLSKIWRIIIFLEDKKYGHILEIENVLVDDWKAGDWVAWVGSSLHMAANLGTENRYTLQITGICTSLM